MVLGTEFRYANIIIDISHEKVDRPFTYKIPPQLREKIGIGTKVRVPFGRGNGERTGYVVDLTAGCAYPDEKVKEILGVLEEKEKRESSENPEERATQLAFWMRNRYGSTAIAALKTVMPNMKGAGMLERRTVVLTAETDRVLEMLEVCRKKHKVAQERLLQSLLTDPVQPYSLITEKLHVSAASIKALENAGMLRIDVEKQYRNPIHIEGAAGTKIDLSPEQQAIVDDVLQDYDDGKTGVSLLHGITGSGKTEVYIRIIEGIVKRGRQAIFLIPEIALTYQTLLRFYRHFGTRVSVLNSTLSESEKADQRRRAAEGEIDVIIGPRSALFTPFPKIGIIVIDEEHENAYKNEQMPKYHARDVAEKICQMHGAMLLLGSATPSLEAYHRTVEGRSKRYELKRRLTGGTLPRVTVADMREELRNGNRSIFSEQLLSLMDDRMRKGEQIILFLNRRGLAGFVSCRNCGYVVKCPHCDVSLSEHRGGVMLCHYCGYKTEKPKNCPECGSRYIAGFKAGTEMVEAEVKKMYPTARVLRMDADTTSRKDSYEKILTAFSNEEADVLVGTQMIVKGHDFPKVTLVGILLADLSLNAGDYRAGERTFQLLTQAAGRAGRGERPGEVVIQTYDPDHYSIQYASRQDYESFYEEEMLYRQLLHYPPAEHMLAVQITDPAEDSAMALAGELREAAEKALAAHADARDTVVIGPSPASIGKLRDLYRFAVYIKARNYDTLVHCKDLAEERCGILKENGTRYGESLVQFDFDPVNPF